MRDMVAQCESNMSELQQLQVLSPVPQFPQGSQCSEAKGSPVGLIRVDQAQVSRRQPAMLLRLFPCQVGRPSEPYFFSL